MISKQDDKGEYSIGLARSRVNKMISEQVIGKLSIRRAMCETNKEIPKQ